MHHLQKVTCVIATITFSTAVAPWFHVLSLKIMIALVAQDANVVAKKAGLVIAMVMFMMVYLVQMTTLDVNIHDHTTNHRPFQVLRKCEMQTA